MPDENDLGYTIPFMPTTAPRDWARLIQRIEEFNFSSLDFDVIGQLYERLVSSSERRRFGQFYTSPDVVDLITAFCIRSPDDRVLDPACGGGTFLVRAYSRKRTLAQSAGGPPLSHERLLGDIFGVDIGAFPAQLSTINLAVRHLNDEANYPRVARASFFDAQAGIPLYDIPLTGDSKRSIALEEVDAVVGNPPYIRQESIGHVDKSSYAELFRTEWPGQTMLSGRSDIYAYFFTHAAHLLKPGGYLGFVTSVGWLDTEYGFRLQEFFLHNFRIVTVIESQVEKWFEDARVTTAVTILQREPDRTKRDNNPVRFIQLRKPSLVTARERCSARGTYIARTDGVMYWIRSCPATGRQECAGTFGPMPHSPSRTSMSTWRSGESSTQYGCRATKCCNTRSLPC